MRYRAISLENDQRRAHFAYFSTMQNPYVGLTAEVEAGAILGACHRNGWPFSLTMVWCTGRAANAVPALRQRILNGGIDDGEEALGLLFLSSIPWLHYTAITQPTPVPADRNPRITWGKYALRDGRLCLPVTLLVNHALADGLHIAHFFEALRAEMDALAEQ